MFAFGLQLGLFFCKKGTLGSSRTTWSEPHHLLFRAKKEDIRRFHGVILVFFFLTINPNPNHPREHERNNYIVRQREVLQLLFQQRNPRITTNTIHKNDILHILRLFRLESFDQQRNHESKQNMLGYFLHVKNGIFFQAQMSKPPTNHPPTAGTNAPLENYQHMIHTRVTYHVG